MRVNKIRFLNGDYMNIPFEVEKYEKEKSDYELKRFFELQRKYKDNIDEIIEFAELWSKLVRNPKSKWID